MKKNRFIASTYIESIYYMCDDMKNAIKKGKVEATYPEEYILHNFMCFVDDFLDKLNS